MSKKPKAVVKLQIQAGKATPAPPIGPALAQYGINMGQFCLDFNNKTNDRMGSTVPVVINVYDGGGYDFITKESPTAELILKATGISKGSGTPNKKKVGKITKQQLKEVAEKKIGDLNTTDIDAAMRTVAGTARNMGITVEE